jgi:hypothetical protein
MTEARRQLPFFPDFFIIGAPRCGTTSLCSFLRKHPRICFSRPKETHYFSKLAPAFGLENIENHYLRRCFSSYDPARHLAVGEGSVEYVYSLEVIETILSFNPSARFIVMARDPMEMLPSYHARMLFILQEDEPSFARAWELQEARARGEHVPRYCIDPELLRYRDVARYAALLRRLYTVVESERCLVLLFDDFRRDPRAVYERCLAFLGVPSDGRTEFRQRQPSRRYRYAWVQRIVYPPIGNAIRLAAEIERRATRRGRPSTPRRGSARKSWIKRLRKRLKAWNTIVAAPEPLPPQLRAAIRDNYADDVADLGHILHRDLSHWLRLSDDPSEPESDSATAPQDAVATSQLASG